MKFYILLHIVALIYWLGADLGVYYSSKYINDRSLSSEARLTAAKLGFFLDLFPRFAMPLMVFSGFAIAIEKGILGVPDYSIIIGVLFFLTWVTLIPCAYKGHLLKFDLWFRVVVVALLFSWVLYSLYYNYTIENKFNLATLSDGKPITPEDFTPLVAPLGYWLAAKIFFFTVTVLLGIGIRITLAPFSAYLGNLAQNKDLEQSNEGIDKCLRKTKVFVHGIWICLVINLAFGIHLINV